MAVGRRRTDKLHVEAVCVKFCSCFDQKQKALRCYCSLTLLALHYSPIVLSTARMYHSVIAVIASTVLIGWTADAFSHHVHQHNDRQRQRWSTLQQSPCADHSDQWSSSSALHAEMSDAELSSASASSKIPNGENYSTLTLLEHMHLLNTNVHTQSTTSNSKRSDMIDFFTTTLGFGMDPKSVDSLLSNKGVVLAMF